MIIPQKIPIKRNKNCQVMIQAVASQVMTYLRVPDMQATSQDLRKYRNKRSQEMI
jgi:hypothetical protein